MNDLKIIKSERGRDLIVYQGYTFYKEKHVNEGVKWRCTHRGCLSKLYLDECSTVIFREEIVNSPVELTQQFNSNDINRIRKNIYYEHRKNYPILLKSLNDTHNTIQKLKIKTNIDEDFLLDNNSEKNIIIFSTKKNFKYICEKSIIFVDGTFSHCPNFFYQMFTLHTVHNNYYVPLIFALLPNKTIKTDFEQAIHNAINAIFPLCKIIGCRFHLSQSWYRKIHNLGLTTDYRSETEIGKWLLEVGESYTDDFMSTIPENHAVQEFSDYLVDNYISDEGLFNNNNNNNNKRSVSQQHTTATESNRFFTVRAKEKPSYLNKC
ncbi:hypothetical protein AGLY_007234 [Aphis glycines]|uniref:FLYWCH-type domain-containing protein n=1 Tax=Aphis glycines TaxID=307491 RepID=A0A6G0TPF9_APHGL|nr:hypothetical protein AGLY_007234 [Aphis glycines]